MFKSIYKKNISYISGLKDGWNGEGSLCISERAISRLETILSFTKLKMDFFPSGDGSIVLEYISNDAKRGIEFEIYDDDIYYSSIENYEYIIMEEPITLEDSIAILTNYTSDLIIY